MSFVKFKSKLAFTMAELMVVIFIVSIISAAALPTLTKRQTVPQSSSIPPGTIIIWYGSTKPEGFEICDGTNGTPDLRGKFILGANASGAADVRLDAFGTSTTAALPLANIPAHTHSITVSDNAHTHAYSTPADSHTHSATTGAPDSHDHSLTSVLYTGTADYSYIFSGAPSIFWSYKAAYTDSGSVDYDFWHQHTIRVTDWTGTHNHGSPFTSTSASPAHTHSYTVSTGGGGTGAAFNIMPPYYALYYIMKT